MLMRRGRVVSLVLLGVMATTLAGVLPVRADEWQPITPEDLKMTGLPEAPGAPAVILYKQVDRNDAGVQRGRGASEYNYIRIKIFTEEGRKYANVEIPFLKQRTSISTIRARTIKPDGTISNFDGKVYEEVVEKTKGEKYLAKKFTLPDVQPGSIVEYHYNIDLEDNYIFRSYWLISEELFTKKAVFSLKPYAYYPWNVQWSWPAGLPVGTEQPKQGPDGIVHMTSINIPAFLPEDHMPPENELKFRVVFIYRDEPFEPNVDKYWKQWGKKTNGKAEGFVDKRKAMEEAVNGIVAPGDAPEVKLRKIYDRVQQIKNLSYLPRMSSEQIKQENLKEPGNVEELWKNQFGYGWQLTWLYLGLVRAAGFEAYPCFVAQRNEYFFRKERTDGRELSDNIVVVKVSGQDRYFDPGAAFTPFGMLPWVETGTIGMKLDKEGGSWIETPLPPSSDSRIERKADFKLTPEGDLEGTVTATYSGLEGQWRRLEERNQDDTERKKFLEEGVKDTIPAGSEVELTKGPDWNSSENPVVAEFKVKIPGWASPAGKRLMLPTSFFSANEKHMFEHANRTWPIYFHFPYKATDDVSIHLPDGWKAESVPAAVDRDLKGAEYSMKAEKTDTTVQVQRMLREDLFLVGKENYSVLRGFFQFVKTQDEQQVVLQPSAAAASN
ncbi:MAG TPA: DUF3857 domain-containing protein [Candidatus Dormibacteraeota bacterium]|jgi:hypothetical protein|nr:DUF3857 domain-containing protein [Candidatus Dormibacteraeota bacterium]